MPLCVLLRASNAHVFMLFTYLRCLGCYRRTTVFNSFLMKTYWIKHVFLLVFPHVSRRLRCNKNKLRLFRFYVEHIIVTPRLETYLEEICSLIFTLSFFFALTVSLRIMLYIPVQWKSSTGEIKRSFFYFILFLLIISVLLVASIFFYMNRFQSSLFTQYLRKGTFLSLQSFFLFQYQTVSFVQFFYKNKLLLIYLFLNCWIEDWIGMNVCLMVSWESHKTIDNKKRVEWKDEDERCNSNLK